MKILHVINGGGVIGGSEKMLLKLCLSREFKFDTLKILVLSEKSDVYEFFCYHKLDVVPLGINKNPLSWLKLFKVSKIIKEFQPDIIQGWLYYSDIVVGLFGLWNKAPTVWSIRQSNLSKEFHSRFIRFSVFVCALFSHILPSFIISNSRHGIKTHSSVGYDSSKMVFIPNGFDCDKFVFTKSAKSRLMTSLSLPKNVKLVGFVGRFNIQKNHRGFIRAAKLISEQVPEVHFCLIGHDVTYENLELNEIIVQSGVHKSKFSLLGKQENISFFMSAFDVLALTSAGEAFPNVLGEAMLCETFCVATDVGDCKEIIGKFGGVVDREDMISLAREIVAALNMSRQRREQIGVNARNKIIKDYDIDVIASRYKRAYLNSMKTH